MWQKKWRPIHIYLLSSRKHELRLLKLAFSLVELADLLVNSLFLYHHLYFFVLLSDLIQFDFHSMCVILQLLLLALSKIYISCPCVDS